MLTAFSLAAFTGRIHFGHPVSQLSRKQQVGSSEFSQWQIKSESESEPERERQTDRKASKFHPSRGQRAFSTTSRCKYAHYTDSRPDRLSALTRTIEKCPQNARPQKPCQPVFCGDDEREISGKSHIAVGRCRQDNSTTYTRQGGDMKTMSEGQLAFENGFFRGFWSCCT